MKSISKILIIVFVLSLTPVNSAVAGSMCNNGKYSTNSGRGTCSWNGGVNKNYPSYSDYGSSSWSRNNAPSSRYNSNCFTTKDWLGRSKRVCY